MVTRPGSANPLWRNACGLPQTNHLKFNNFGVDYNLKSQSLPFEIWSTRETEGEESAQFICLCLCSAAKSAIQQGLFYFT